MKALENSSYMDFCSTLDIYLERVEKAIKDAKKAKQQMKTSS